MLFKKLVFGLFAVLFTFGLAACDTEGPEGPAQQQPGDTMAPTEEPAQQPDRPAGEPMQQ